MHQVAHRDRQRSCRQQGEHLSEYYAEFDTRQTLGGLFRMMDTAKFEAESDASARKQAQAIAREKKWRVHKVSRIRTYEVTFRHRKDKRKRETFIVTAISDRQAKNNGRYLAQQSRHWLEFEPINVVEKEVTK